jgi:Cu/Ag efflux protein CusF
MRTIITMVLALSLTGPALAQMNMPMPAPAAPGAATQVLGPAFGKGEVTRVDEATGRLGIRHEPIPALNMANSMNMQFRLADPAMLTAVKVGDVVTFEATRTGAEVTIVKIEKAPAAP